MQDTSRKIPKEQILQLEEFQLSLKKKGIHLNQKKLLIESICFALDNTEEFIKNIKKTDNRYEKTLKLLKSTQKRYDFGKNWLNEIDTAL